MDPGMRKILQVENRSRFLSIKLYAPQSKRCVSFRLHLCRRLIKKVSSRNALPMNNKLCSLLYLLLAYATVLPKTIQKNKCHQQTANNLCRNFSRVHLFVLLHLLMYDLSKARTSHLDYFQNPA